MSGPSLSMRCSITSRRVSKRWSRFSKSKLSLLRTFSTEGNSSTVTSSAVEGIISKQKIEKHVEKLRKMIEVNQTLGDEAMFAQFLQESINSIFQLKDLKRVSLDLRQALDRANPDQAELINTILSLALLKSNDLQGFRKHFDMVDKEFIRSLNNPSFDRLIEELLKFWRENNQAINRLENLEEKVTKENFGNPSDLWELAMMFEHINRSKTCKYLLDLLRIDANWKSGEARHLFERLVDGIIDRKLRLSYKDEYQQILKAK